MQQRADFRMKFARERFAITGVARSGAEVHVERHAAFAEEIEQMRGEGHVAPVRDFIGDGAAFERIAQCAGGDGAAEFHDRIEERAAEGKHVVAAGARALGEKRERHSGIETRAVGGAWERELPFGQGADGAERSEVCGCSGGCDTIFQN